MVNNQNLKLWRSKVQVLKRHEVPGFTGVHVQAGEGKQKLAALETKATPHDNHASKRRRSSWQREDRNFPPKPCQQRVLLIAPPAPPLHLDNHQSHDNQCLGIVYLRYLSCFEIKTTYRVSPHSSPILFKSLHSIFKLKALAISIALLSDVSSDRAGIISGQ